MIKIQDSPGQNQDGQIPTRKKINEIKSILQILRSPFSIGSRSTKKHANGLKRQALIINA
jgi:hypothetical protein